MKSNPSLIFLASAFFILSNIAFFNTTYAQASDADPYLAFAEKMPEVEGGLNNLYKTIRYPEIARKAGISGKVYVMAFVNEDGSISDVKVIKGIGGGCDEAAVNAVKSAKFTPGVHQGQPVKVKLSLPVIFQLK